MFSGSLNIDWTEQSPEKHKRTKTTLMGTFLSLLGDHIFLNQFSNFSHWVREGTGMEVNICMLGPVPHI